VVLHSLDHTRMAARYGPTSNASIETAAAALATAVAPHDRHWRADPDLGLERGADVSGMPTQPRESERVYEASHGI
jgi:hypothetical protein